MINDSVELPSLFCSAQTIPVTGSTFNPSTRPAIAYSCWTAPLGLYWTISLSPPPVETPVLAYSTQIDPSPFVIESGPVPPTGAPVANTETLVIVGSAGADAPVDGNTVPNVM